VRVLAGVVVTAGAPQEGRGESPVGGGVADDEDPVFEDGVLKRAPRRLLGWAACGDLNHRRSVSTG
jgi:hypothetical protein